MADSVNSDVPRILMNRDAVGTIGDRDNDLLVLGDLSDLVENVVDLLEWNEDMEKIFIE